MHVRTNVVSVACSCILVAACTQAAPNQGSPQAAAATPRTSDEAPVSNTKAGGGACQPMVDALLKLAVTPNEQLSTGTDGEKSESNRMISTGNEMFIQIDGKWHKSPYNAQQLMADMKDNASTIGECTRVGVDSVDGQPVTVYASHDQQDATDSVDTQLWISNATGLPLKQTIDIDVGGGDTGKSHKDVRFDYDHVQPPGSAK